MNTTINMKSYPKTIDCTLEGKGNWLTIWLNRPEKRNALSKNLIEELGSVLSICEKNRSLRGIIFRGKGSTFCAGADLKWMQNIALNKEVSAEAIHNMSCMFGDIFENISKMSPITISVVEGSSMAGGIGIMCATDLIITMADTNFSLTETKIGLTPAQIAPYVINKVGFQQAKKLMLLAESFSGQEAFDMGMADYICHNEKDINSHINDIIEQVQLCSPNAIAVTKRLLKTHLDIDTANASKLFSECMLHNEGREGFASFFQKRKPFWTIKEQI